jgi:hypothetical protein
VDENLTVGETESALTAEQYIEFDGQQLVVRSDAAEIIDFVSRTYRPMLVPRLTTSAGWIEVRRAEGEYVLDWADGPDFHGDLESVCRYLRHQVQLRFIRERSDLLWLHAGAVEREGRCLLISGPTGHGKSSLVTLLCERGWRMLSDDVAPVRMDTLEVLPYPERPVRRVYPGRDLRREEVGLLERESVEMSDDAISREAARISGIVLPVFQGGAKAELVRLAAGDAALELVRNCMNFVDHKEAAVDFVSRIARAVPIYRLCYGTASETVHLLDGLGRHLEVSISV